MIVRVAGREFPDPRDAGSGAGGAGNAWGIDDAIAAAHRFETAGADAVHVTGWGRNSFSNFTDGPLPDAVGAYRDDARAVKDSIVRAPGSPWGGCFRRTPRRWSPRALRLVAMGPAPGDPDLVAKPAPAGGRRCGPAQRYVCVEQNIYDDSPRCPSPALARGAGVKPTWRARATCGGGRGAGGMEVARVAGERGHRITLLEACGPPGRTAWFSQLTTPPTARRSTGRRVELVARGRRAARLRRHRAGGSPPSVPTWCGRHRHGARPSRPPRSTCRTTGRRRPTGRDDGFHRGATRPGGSRRGTGPRHLGAAPRRPRPALKGDRPGPVVVAAVLPLGRRVVDHGGGRSAWSCRAPAEAGFRHGPRPGPASGLPWRLRGLDGRPPRRRHGVENVRNAVARATLPTTSSTSSRARRGARRPIRVVASEVLPSADDDGPAPGPRPGRGVGGGRRRRGRLHRGRDPTPPGSRPGISERGRRQPAERPVPIERPMGCIGQSIEAAYEKREGSMYDHYRPPDRRDHRTSGCPSSTPRSRLPGHPYHDGGFVEVSDEQLRGR